MFLAKSRCSAQQCMRDQ